MTTHRTRRESKEEYEKIGEGEEQYLLAEGKHHLAAMLYHSLLDNDMVRHITEHKGLPCKGHLQSI